MEQELEILINRVWITPGADRLLSFLSDFSAWAPWLLGLVVIGILFGNFKLRAVILTIGLAIGLSDGIMVNLLKHAVARPRPSQVEPGVRSVTLGKPPGHFPRITGLFSEPIVIFPHGTIPPREHSGFVACPDTAHEIRGRSFPSGHAANNMAAATVLICFYRRWGWFYLPIALLIAYARIYTGAHWPLDVAAGILVGVAGGWLAVKIMQLLWRRFGSRAFSTLSAEHPDLIH
jgi:undecaprenyl-diphosphatase